MLLQWHSYIKSYKDSGVNSLDVGLLMSFLRHPLQFFMCSLRAVC
jgi:hypothetical protein